MSEPFVFRRGRIVAPGDIDFLGHVNNVVWLRYVVELAKAHAGSLDAGRRIEHEQGALWIVRRHELDYHANAGSGDEIAEETWVESMRGARSIRASRFTRPADGARLVTARTQWAFVDAATLRPRRIPAELSRLYGKAD